MLIERYKYSYAKFRDWHVGAGKSAILAARYALTGDSGRFTSHGGWRVSHLRIADRSEGSDDTPGADRDSN